MIVLQGLLPLKCHSQTIFLPGRKESQEILSCCKNLKFAEILSDSTMFADFCDDYFDKDVSNMHIYLNIASNGFDKNSIFCEYLLWSHHWDY